MEYEYEEFDSKGLLKRFIYMVLAVLIIGLVIFMMDKRQQAKTNALTPENFECVQIFCVEDGDPSGMNIEIRKRNGSFTATYTDAFHNVVAEKKIDEAVAEQIVARVCEINPDIYRRNEREKHATKPPESPATCITFTYRIIYDSGKDFRYVSDSFGDKDYFEFYNDIKKLAGLNDN